MAIVNEPHQEPESGGPAPLETIRHTHAPRSRKRTIWLVLLALVVVSIAAYSFASRTSPDRSSQVIASVPTVVVKVGTVEKTIRLAGQTAARRYASLVVTRFRGQPSMGASGLVLTKLAEGGTIVKAGDVVAQLDTENILTTLDDMEANIEQAKLDIERLKAQQALEYQTLEQTIRSVKADYEKAVLDYKKAEVLTPVEQELLKLNMEEAEARYKQQMAALEYQKISMAAALRASEINLERQQLRYERTLNDLKTFTFRAPMDGMVVLQTVERSGGTMAQYTVGDTVNPGRSFMKIVDPSSMQVEASANQAEAEQLRIGQPATVTLDAFPEVVLPGKVYSLGAMARASRFESYYVRSIPVVIQIDGSDPRMLPDMSAAANVVVGRAENLPVVPLQAVHSEAGRYYVFLKTASSFEKRYIEVALTGATEAAVKEGLQAGDQVALATPPTPATR